MKTSVLNFFSFSCIILVLSAGVSISSCKKDQICHGIVHVYDTSGVVVNNANVLLAAPTVQGEVTYSGVTDASGQVLFEVKLPAIFDVTATKASYPGKTGVGIIRLDEPGKTGEVTVIIK